jgi:hypothetical protein
MLTKNGAQNQLILDRLALCDAINWHPSYGKEVLNASIDLARVFREQCAIYCALNTTSGPNTAPEIARILFSALLMAGTSLPQSERKMKVLIVADEIQTCMSSPSSIERLLAQSRQAGASVLLSFQVWGDMMQERDLSSSILGNCAVQQFFNVTDNLGVSKLVELSGTTLEPMVTDAISSGPNGDTISRSISHQITKRLDTGDILRSSASPGHFLIRATSNEGLCHYDGHLVEVRCGHHITFDEYRVRQQSPPPVATPDKILVGYTKRDEPARTPSQVTPKPTHKPPSDSPVIGTGQSTGSLFKKRDAK